jgi:hypothetical protein
MFGAQRCRGYLMRLRLEHLVEADESCIGRRRATHVGALIEAVYLSYQDELTTGLFYNALKDKIDERLKNAHYQPQEQHFRDLEWWNKLDRIAARNELASNLDRLITDEPTPCLVIGIELHVLFDGYMRTGYGTRYESVITDARVQDSFVLRKSMDRFNAMVERKAA